MGQVFHRHVLALIAALVVLLMATAVEPQGQVEKKVKKFKQQQKKRKKQPKIIGYSHGLPKYRRAPTANAVFKSCGQGCTHNISLAGTNDSVPVYIGTNESVYRFGDVLAGTGHRWCE